VQGAAVHGDEEAHLLQQGEGEPDAAPGEGGGAPRPARGEVSAGLAVASRGAAEEGDAGGIARPEEGIS
jgi:hypothetical protein